MTSFGDFSSLLQLGVGTGIGLSLFRAPVDLRVARIARTIEAELVALRGAVPPFARSKRRALHDLNLTFRVVRQRLERQLKPFMVAAVIGALVNLWALVEATVRSNRPISPREADALIFLSVGWFVLEIVALEVLARIMLRATTRELASLRAKRAPEAQSA